MKDLFEKKIEKKGTIGAGGHVSFTSTLVEEVVRNVQD